MHIHTIQLNIETLEGGVQHMDATEFGAYMSLLVCCYKSNNKLPTDDKRLARMARVSPRIWKKIKDIVLEKFKLSDGYVSHTRVQKELDKYQTLSKKNKSNALKKNKTQEPVGKRNKSQNQANTNNNNQSPNNNIITPNPLNKGKEFFDIPNFVDGDVWMRWVKFRKEKKKTLTPTTIEAQIKKITKWHEGGHDVNAIIEQSIAQGWVGLFELKKGNGNDGLTKSQRADRELQELLDRERY